MRRQFREACRTLNVTVDEPSLTFSSAGHNTTESSVPSGSYIVSPISSPSNSDQRLINQIIWTLTHAQSNALPNSSVFQRTALEGPDGKHGGYRRVWRPDLDVKERFDRTIALLVVQRRVATDGRKMLPAFRLQMYNQLSPPPLTAVHAYFRTMRGLSLLLILPIIAYICSDVMLVSLMRRRHFELDRPKFIGNTFVFFVWSGDTR